MTLTAKIFSLMFHFVHPLWTVFLVWYHHHINTLSSYSELRICRYVCISYVRAGLGRNGMQGYFNVQRAVHAVISSLTFLPGFVWFRLVLQSSHSFLQFSGETTQARAKNTSLRMFQIWSVVGCCFVLFVLRFACASCGRYIQECVMCYMTVNIHQMGHQLTTKYTR